MLIVLCASWGLQKVTIKIANEAVSPILQSNLQLKKNGIPAIQDPQGFFFK
jgi:hypothetical protein